MVGSISLSMASRTRLFSTENAVGGSGIKRGQEVTATILQFGPLGASVSINDGAANGT